MYYPNYYPSLAIGSMTIPSTSSQNYPYLPCRSVYSRLCIDIISSYVYIISTLTIHISHPVSHPKEAAPKQRGTLARWRHGGLTTAAHRGGRRRCVAMEISPAISWQVAIQWVYQWVLHPWIYEIYGCFWVINDLGILNMGDLLVLNKEWGNDL